MGKLVVRYFYGELAEVAFLIFQGINFCTCWDKIFLSLAFDNFFCGEHVQWKLEGDAVKEFECRRFFAAEFIIDNLEGMILMVQIDAVNFAPYLNRSCHYFDVGIIHRIIPGAEIAETYFKEFRNEAIGVFFFGKEEFIKDRIFPIPFYAKDFFLLVEVKGRIESCGLYFFLSNSEDEIFGDLEIIFTGTA